MADEKDPYGGMLIGDPQYMDLQRRKAMAKAMIEGTMGAHAPMPMAQQFKRNPLAIVADFMSARGAREKIKSISAEEQAMFAKFKAGEAQGTRELIDGMSQGDPREAITRALASQYPGVRKLAETMFKSNNENFGQVLSNFKDQVSLPSAISSAGGGAHIGGLQPAPPMSPPQIQVGQTPSGQEVPWLQSQKRNGEYTVNMVPQGTRIDNRVHMGDKPALETEEQQGKFYAAGGKGFEQGQQLQAQLQTTQDTLRTIMENPALGAGAEGFQILRKWANALIPGIDGQLSANTEQAKMQLAQAIIKELGGLGNQVSNADVEFIAGAMGNIGSDPNALRRMLLLSMKYQMRKLGTLGEQAKQIEQVPVFARRGTQFPGYNFGVNLPQAAADDLELIFGGRMPKLGSPSVKPPSSQPPPGVRRVP